MKRLFPTLFAAIGLAGLFGCESDIRIGSAEIKAPDGWRVVQRENERINIATPNGNQQATISVMRFGSPPSFADFRRICEIRLKAEQDEAPGILIHAEEPFNDAGKFGLFFSGEEQTSSRRFSAHISQNGTEVVTIYLESIETEPAKHTKAFEDFVHGLKQ